MQKTPLTDLIAYSGAFLTAGQLADYWGVSRKHILKLIETGRLESIRLGPKTYRVRVHAAIEFERQSRRLATESVAAPAQRAPDRRLGLPAVSALQPMPSTVESQPMTAASARRQIAQ